MQQGMVTPRAWLSGATRGEGSRQQELLTLRGKRTPTPGVCGDSVQQPGEEARGTGKERDRDGKEARGAGLRAEFTP